MDKPINRGGLYARYFGEPVTKTPRAVTEKPKALPKVGRPKKADALTPAQKQAAYRERKKAHG